jgi:hypothetical protein
MTEQNTEELRARIAAARKQKQQTEEKREALKQTPAELERELAKAEREAKEAETLLELESKHGKDKIGYIETDLGMVVLSRPHAALFRRFQDQDKATVLEVEKLVRPCVIHPTKERFDMMCEEQPMILARAAEVVSRLAGFRNKDLEAK